MDRSSDAPNFEILPVLRLAAQLWWQQFAPITILGLALVTGPSVLLHAAFGARATTAPADTIVGTMVQTLTALLLMLFACAVSYGIMATIAGRRLEPAGFMRAGLWAARPGVLVALVLGAGGVGLSIVLLLFSRAGGGMLTSLLVIAAALWALALFLPAVPAAIAERRLPLDALRRSIELTRGARLRLVGMALLICLALLPIAGLVRVVIFGANATTQDVERVISAMTLASPGLWIAELFNLLLVGMLAVLPAVVYAELAGLSRRSGSPPVARR